VATLPFLRLLRRVMVPLQLLYDSVQDECGVDTSNALALFCSLRLWRDDEQSEQSRGVDRAFRSNSEEEVALRNFHVESVLAFHPGNSACLRCSDAPGMQHWFVIGLAHCYDRRMMRKIVRLFRANLARRRACC